jgi:hypothetical protein
MAPRRTAQHTVFILRIVPILAPLPYVASHIIQPILICREALDRTRPRVPIVTPLDYGPAFRLDRLIWNRGRAGAVLASGGCRSQRLVVAFGLDPVLVPVAPFERRVSFYRFRVCLISGLLIFKICSQRDLDSAPDFIERRHLWQRWDSLFERFELLWSAHQQRNHQPVWAGEYRQGAKG